MVAVQGFEAQDAATVITGQDGLRQTLDQIEKFLVGVLGNADADKIRCETANDIYKLSVAAASIARAKSDLNDWQLEKEHIKAKVTEELTQSVKGMLAARPELYEQVLELIHQAAGAANEQLLLEEREDHPLSEKRAALLASRLEQRPLRECRVS